MLVQKDYEDLLRLLNKHKVRYCIIGAYAVAFYGMPRYTKDMDILVEPSPQNAKKIVRALMEFGFKKSGLGEEDFSRKGKIIQLGYEPVRVDIMTSIQGVEFGKIWKGKTVGRYGKQKIYFVGKSELIKNKKMIGRKQDEIDLKFLSR